MKSIADIMKELNCEFEFYIAPKCKTKPFEDFGDPVVYHIDSCEVVELSTEEYEKLHPPIRYTCRDGTPIDEAEGWTTEELAEIRKNSEGGLMTIPGDIPIVLDTGGQEAT